MILGLRTAIYPAPDLAAARDWYAEVLGIAPYFDQPLDPITDVGQGIRVAAVIDPFGNRFGLIENPHFNAGAVR
jgi:hypothetical protein